MPRCIVPFCTRTTGANHHEEWICPGHWRLTDSQLRRRFFLFNRRNRPDLAARMWERLKKQAIERAMGIS